MQLEVVEPPDMSSLAWEDAADSLRGKWERRLGWVLAPIVMRYGLDRLDDGLDALGAPEVKSLVTAHRIMFDAQYPEAAGVDFSKPVLSKALEVVKPPDMSNFDRERTVDDPDAKWRMRLEWLLGGMAVHYGLDFFRGEDIKRLFAVHRGAFERSLADEPQRKEAERRWQQTLAAMTSWERAAYFARLNTALVFD
jgi:hypothetical protein